MFEQIFLRKLTNTQTSTQAFFWSTFRKTKKNQKKQSDTPVFTVTHADEIRANTQIIVW